MGSNGQCCWPRCRQETIVALGFADNVRLCERHWGEYCDIDLEEDATIAQVVRYEKRCQRFQAKCGSGSAKRRLAKIEQDPDNYKLQTVGTGDGGHRTVAEYREIIAARSAGATVEEPQQEEEEEVADEFSGLGNYLE